MKNLEDIELMSWNLISGIPRSVNAAGQIIRNAEIREKTQNFVRKTKVAKVYATLMKGNIYGIESNFAVYLNPMKALNEREDSNSELFHIEKELDNLSIECME